MLGGGAGQGAAQDAGQGAGHGGTAGEGPRRPDASQDVVDGEVNSRHEAGNPVVATFLCTLCPGRHPFNKQALALHQYHVHRWVAPPSKCVQGSVLELPAVQCGGVHQPPYHVFQMVWAPAAEVIGLG